MPDQTEGKVPEVRFAGYTEEWTEVPMGELLSFKNGYNAGKEQYGTGEKFINVLDIIENDFITHDRIIGRVNLSNEDFKKNEVTFGDILFQRSSETREEVGQANVYLDEDKSATFGGFVIRGKPIAEFDAVFFNVMLKSAKARAEITSRSGGSTRYNIGQDSLAEALVTIAPDTDEQEKIAQLWMSLDRMIDLHQRKHDKLVTLKQAMLQKMFPQDGATTPDIRFKGFEGEWEQRQLLQGVTKIVDFRGRTPKKLGLDWSPKGYLALSAVNVKKGFIDFSADAHFGDDELYDAWMKGSDLHQNQVLFTTEAPMGNVAQVPDGQKYILSQRTIAFEVDPNLISEDFFAILLRSPFMFRKLSSLSSGGTAKGVSQRSLESVTSVFPKDIKEQQKIGSYFRNLDELVSKYATQLEKLKNIKSACLEKMFV